MLEDSEPGVSAPRWAAGMTPIMVPDLHPPSGDLLARRLFVAAVVARGLRVLVEVPSPRSAGACDARARRVRFDATSRAVRFRACMIGRIAGMLLEKNPPQILVDVQGVGYEVDVPMSTFYNLPATRRASHAAHAPRGARGRAPALRFRHATASARAFRQLLEDLRRRRAHRALGAVGLSVADLAQAVTPQDAGRLIKVPGIGKKTAERLLLELKGKLGAELTAAVGVHGRRRSASDVLNALLALGYSDKEAQPRSSSCPRALPSPKASGRR